VFLESPRFPLELSFDSSAGPRLKTSVLATAGGFEKRNREWLKSRYVFEIALNTRRGDEVENFNAFFELVGGREKGFRLRYEPDYKANNQLCEPITSTKYQLKKSHLLSPFVQSRTITKPVVGTVKVFVGGVLQSVGFIIDHTTGVITFATPPSGEVRASFEFDFPVRFDQDEVFWTVSNKNPNENDVFLFDAQGCTAIEDRGI
jgi:uncharacterized protein (TIGR02217 family)